MNRKAIVVIALAIEGALFGSYLGWAYWRGLGLTQVLSGNWAFSAAYGVFGGILLLGVNLTLFEVVAPRYPRLDQCRRFKEEYIIPLARMLRPIDALVVSAAAGIGEEFFFRGVLQVEIGILLSSIIFAAVHFGPAVRQYSLVALIYFLVSLYFAAIYSVSQDLWAVALAHGIYDFLVIIFIRRQERL